MKKAEIEFLRTAGFTITEIMAMNPAPADPAPAPAPADPQNAMLEKLDKILAAVQAGNRAGAKIQTPAKKTPEEIAGQLY